MSSGVPHCSIRPSFMTAIRSRHRQRLVLVVRDEDEGDADLALDRLSSTCIAVRSLRSSAASGSSSSSTVGRLTSARASATRCRWPPESCVGSSLVAVR